MPSVRKILIVEEEKELREFLKDSLSMYSVAEAKNAQDGIALAKANPPDLLISAIRMSGMSGVEMLAQLRKSEIFCAAIFISGLADNVKQEEIAQLGAFDFVERPISNKKLLSAVKNALLLGTKSIATFTFYKHEGALSEQREYYDIMLKGVPASVVNRLHAYSAKYELSMEKIILDWIQERLDKV